MSFKQRTDQQGIAHLLVIVMLLVVVAAIGAAAWKVSSHSKAPTSGTVQQSKVAIAAVGCLQAIKDTNICNFASHYNPNAAYKATDTSTTSDGNSTLTISSDGKGNSQISGTGGGTSLDAITLNGAYYIKDPTTGTWTKYSSGSATQSTTNPADSLKISASDITGNGTITYKNLGTTACGSDTCFKYQIVDTSQTDTTQYVWFDNKDYQLHEFYSKNGDSTNDMTFTYQAVNITAPSPVQDFSASQ